MISELNLAQKTPLDYIQGQTMSLSPEYFPDGSGFQQQKIAAQMTHQDTKTTTSPSNSQAHVIQQKRLKRGSRSVDRSRKQTKLNHFTSQSPPQESNQIMQALQTLQQKRYQQNGGGHINGFTNIDEQFQQQITANDMQNQPNKRYGSQIVGQRAQNFQMSSQTLPGTQKEQNLLQQAITSPQPFRIRFPLSTTVDSNTQAVMTTIDQSNSKVLPQKTVPPFDLSISPNRFNSKQGASDSKHHRESDRMRSELLRLLQAASNQKKAPGAPSHLQQSKMGGKRSSHRKITSSFGAEMVVNRENIANDQSQNVVFSQQKTQLHQLPTEILLSYPSARNTASTTSIPPLDVKSLNPSQKVTRRSRKSTVSRHPKSQSSSHGPKQRGRGPATKIQSGEYTSRTRQKSKISQKQRAANDLLMGVYGSTNSQTQIGANTSFPKQNIHYLNGSQGFQISQQDEFQCQKGLHTKNSHSASDFEKNIQNQAPINFIYDPHSQQKAMHSTAEDYRLTQVRNLQSNEADFAPVESQSSKQRSARVTLPHSKQNPRSPQNSGKPSQIPLQPVLAQKKSTKRSRKAFSHKRLLVSERNESQTPTRDFQDTFQTGFDLKSKPDGQVSKRSSQGKQTRKNELAAFLNKVLSQKRLQSGVQNGKSLKGLLKNKDFGSVQASNYNRRQGGNLFSRGFPPQNNKKTEHIFGVQSNQKSQKNKMLVLLQDHRQPQDTLKDSSKGIFDHKFIQKQLRDPHGKQSQFQTSQVLRTVNPAGVQQLSTVKTDLVRYHQNSHRPEEKNQIQVKQTPTSQSLIHLQQEQENQRQMARLVKSIQHAVSVSTTSPRERTILGGGTILSSDQHSKNLTNLVQVQSQKSESPLIQSCVQKHQTQAEIISDFTRQVQQNSTDPCSLKLHKTTSQKLLVKQKESFTSGESHIVNIQVTKSSEDHKSENVRKKKAEENQQRVAPIIFTRPSDSTPEIDLALSDPHRNSNLILSENLRLEPDPTCPETLIEKEVSKRSVMVQVDIMPSSQTIEQNYLSHQERLSTQRRSSDVSHKENKDSDFFGKKSIDDLLVNQFERQGLESVQEFVEEPLRQLVEALAKENVDCTQLLSSLLQEAEKRMQSEKRQNSQVLNTCYVLVTALTQSCLDLLHRRDYEIAEMESNLEKVVKAGEKTLQESRKRQRTAYVATEKLSLAESMGKLKDKEVSNLKKKVETLQTNHRQKVQTWKQFLNEKEEEIERNNVKFGRELKALYEQNKDLFAHNRALRDDLQDQDEKVRKLGNIVKRHPNIIRNLDAELDQTEPKHNGAHESSTISNAIPMGASRQYEQRTPDSLVKERPSQGKNIRKINQGDLCIEVGPNKVQIPVFDQAVIDKYNKLNIEGKLPHIVESNHFNPESVKEEVKAMLAKDFNFINEKSQSNHDNHHHWEVAEESSTENGMAICTANAPQPQINLDQNEIQLDDGCYDQQLFDSPAGKGPILSRVAERANLAKVFKGYQEAPVNFKDSWNQKSNMNSNNLLTKVPSVNNPNYFFENMEPEKQPMLMMTPGQQQPHHQYSGENELYLGSDVRLMELADDIEGKIKIKESMDMLYLITPAKRKHLMDSVKQQSEEIDFVLDSQKLNKKSTKGQNSNDKRSSFGSQINLQRKGKKNYDQILMRESMENFSGNLQEQINGAAAAIHADLWIGGGQTNFDDPLNSSSQISSSEPNFDRKQTRQIQKDNGHFFQEQQQLWLTQKPLSRDQETNQSEFEVAKNEKRLPIDTDQIILENLDNIAYQQTSSGESKEADFLQMEDSLSGVVATNEQEENQFGIMNVVPGGETLQDQISKHYSPIMRVRQTNDNSKETEEEYEPVDYSASHSNMLVKMHDENGVQGERQEDFRNSVVDDQSQSSELNSQKHDFNMYERDETETGDLPTNSMSLPASDVLGCEIMNDL